MQSSPLRHGSRADLDATADVIVEHLLQHKKVAVPHLVGITRGPRECAVVVGAQIADLIAGSRHPAASRQWIRDRLRHFMGGYARGSVSHGVAVGRRNARCLAMSELAVWLVHVNDRGSHCVEERTVVAAVPIRWIVCTDRT